MDWLFGFVVGLIVGVLLGLFFCRLLRSSDKSEEQGSVQNHASDPGNAQDLASSGGVDDPRQPPSRDH
jgi:uncharacterized membrane-anchored protein YhcB (DUF1043 family)